MKKHSLRFLTLTLVGILIYSCQKEYDFIEPQKEEIRTVGDFQRATKLENPYSLKNMKSALERIKEKLKTNQISARNSNSASDFEITTSHYYIKFKPESEEEEGIIKRDTSMYLSDYPLDYEYTDEYLENRPQLEEGEFPEYYVAVPIDKVLPNNVDYEILEELYIPEEDPIFTSTASAANNRTQQGKINNNEDLLIHLLNEAYSLTGNEDDLVESSNSYANSNLNSTNAQA